jgi:polyphenol oxidase
MRDHPLSAAPALESALLRTAGFRHGFSTRTFDFRPPSAHAVEGLSIVLRLDPLRVFQVTQVHGADVVVARGERDTMFDQRADALVAIEPGIAVGVRVADCVPILLADPKGGGVAAVHAGWRGLVAGVIENAVSLAREQGAELTLAAIGPCIEACCFEVGRDVGEQIAKASTPEAITRIDGDKAHVDLRRAARHKLVALGFMQANVEDVRGCTKHDAERFFSHRRDGEHAGRHLAVIACQPHV